VAHDVHHIHQQVAEARILVPLSTEIEFDSMAKGKLGGIGVTCISVKRPVVKWGGAVFQRFDRVVATLALEASFKCVARLADLSNEN
jgi:hypothetical protein